MRRAQCAGQRNSVHSGEITVQERVGGLLDPTGDISVRRSAIRRIIFEPAILGRIVRGRNDDAVREARCPSLVIGQDRVGNDRGRRVFAAFGDHRFDTVGREHLQRAGKSGFRQRMRIDAHEQRPIDTRRRPVQANRLCDRQDMPFIERTREGRPAMARGAKSDTLRGDRRIGPIDEIGRDQTRYVHQQRVRREFTGEGTGHRVHLLPPAEPAQRPRRRRSPGPAQVVPYEAARPAVSL